MHQKRIVWMGILLAFLLIAPAVLAGTQEGVAGGRLVANTLVGLRDAIDVALKARPGRAVEAELEGDPDGGVFEVVIVTGDSELFEVRVDAKTGRAGNMKKEDGAEEQRELRGYLDVLGRIELPLADLVAKAEAVVKGTAVVAQLDWRGSTACEVVFVNAGDAIEVTVEGKGGRLIGLKLKGMETVGPARAKSEEGDDDDDDDDDDHEDNKEAASDWNVNIPTPLADGVSFSSGITHPFLPLSSVRYTVLESSKEKVIREVLPETKTVAGVACLVLAEKEYERGELAEISYNYFAQDDEGNVYYFGEDVDDYKDGKVVGHGGAWLVGKNAKEPCLIMPARLEIGFRFKPENSPPHAEEFDEIDATDAALVVPAGTYKDLLVIKETDRPPRWEERKYYARGVGLISENGELNLVSIGKEGGGK